ncbi:DNA-binding LytR/AlgR family response regulator [Dysgonomonas hofstadii]|uniref:DNA-binding LytR/AlgR family response regulator n=1 Tax=Dysgonomonas hofstadii TaxID=637886 RepID=A0A840CST7_9BACT|nr:LytTR family DNA-binding domain-containing protein [Dysgonomonas hofstadii]MBB4037749.1 DNA-binding LytR/AlgR family response regulator [Dysgonomonas hofstadii]
MNKKINCVIIDDEPLASDVLKNYMGKTPEFEITGIYNNPIEALKGLNNKKVDVIFCDVEMPDISGLQLLESLFINKETLVVMVSAHSKYAIDGFNIDAIDYLLKPVSFARYLKTTQKILHYVKDKKNKGRNTETQTAETESSKDYFFIKSNSKLLKINYNEILYIEGLGDYIKIHLDNSNKAILILDSLKHLEEILSDGSFQRIHRSYIVPISKIKAIEYKKAIIGDNNLSLPISNSYYNSLYENLVSNNIRK